MLLFSQDYKQVEEKLKAKYSYVLYYESDSCFQIRQNDKNGICDLSGKEIIPPIYTQVFKVSYIDYGVYYHDFSWSYNYQLSETSPGHNAGTDGTDIGPFGGAYPISTTGEPKLPIIELFNINNPIIPLDSVLNIHIKVSNH